MRLFRVDSEKKFTEYEVQSYKEGHREKDLEYLLESNPNSILDEEILIVGRQVTTNLNTYIDLLGLDRSGNTAIIELKRDRTPRDVIAQALEYASWIEQLDYQQLEKIYHEYSGNENEALSDYHSIFFDLDDSSAVNFNKDQHIIIVGSNITTGIRQQAMYLNRKGIPTSCVEFNYFQTQSGETLLSTDVVIGKGYKKTRGGSTEKRPQIDKNILLRSMPENARPFFESLLSVSEAQNLSIHWGSVGFSLNVVIDGKDYNFLEGYPPREKIRNYPIVYVTINNIHKKFEDVEKVTNEYRKRFLDIGYFVPSGNNIKWNIDKKINTQDSNNITSLCMELANSLKKQRVKEK